MLGKSTFVNANTYLPGYVIPFGYMRRVAAGKPRPLDLFHVGVPLVGVTHLLVKNCLRQYRSGCFSLFLGFDNECSQALNLIPK